MQMKPGDNLDDLDQLLKKAGSDLRNPENLMPVLQLISRKLELLDRRIRRLEGKAREEEERWRQELRP